MVDETTESTAVQETAPQETAPIAQETAQDNPSPGSEPQVAASGTGATDQVVEAFKPNTKISVMDKEYEIPKEFHGLMKDKDTEKAVREIFEKAEGLPVVKQRYQEARQQLETTQGEYQKVREGIAGLRNTYQQAVRTQNWLKLDDFFEKLEIPKEHVFAYAVAHAKLMELPQDQRQAIQQSLDADRRAETFASQQASTQSMYARQAQEMKRMEVEITFGNPEVSAVAQDFDNRIGKSGAFRDLVLREGEMEWVRSQGKNNLPVRQAVERVMQNYGLKAGQPAPTAMGAAGTSATPGKNVVQRTDRTIPNIAGRGGASPLKNKPRSVEDLIKIRNQMAASEG